MQSFNGENLNYIFDRIDNFLIEHIPPATTSTAGAVPPSEQRIDSSNLFDIIDSLPVNTLVKLKQKIESTLGERRIKEL